jgi:hypothetical protein
MLLLKSIHVNGFTSKVYWLIQVLYKLQERKLKEKNKLNNVKKNTPL